MKYLSIIAFCFVFTVLFATTGQAQQPVPVPAPAPAPNLTPAPAPNFQSPSGGGSGILVRPLWTEIIITLVFIGLSIFAVVRTSNRQ